MAIMDVFRTPQGIDLLLRPHHHNHPNHPPCEVCTDTVCHLGSKACLPNGDFILPGTVNIWSPAYFFTISIIVHGASGEFTYTTVKIIDVVWDVLMGRGGQLLLIYISYQVFSKALVFLMETRAVSYQA